MAWDNGPRAAAVSRCTRAMARPVSHGHFAFDGGVSVLRTGEDALTDTRALLSRRGLSLTLPMHAHGERSMAETGLNLEEQGAPKSGQYQILTR